MKPIDIIIIVAAALVVVGVIGLTLWRKKQGKTGCGCGCNGCSGCGNKAECSTAKDAQEKYKEE